MTRHVSQSIRSTTARRSDLLLYVSVAIGLSWLRFIPILADHVLDTDLSDSLLLWLTPLASLSPFLGAVAAVLHRSGMTGVRRFLRLGWVWRVPARWYAIVLGVLPLLYIGGALTVYLITGGDFPPLGQLEWLVLAEIFTLGLVLFLAEEYGWRGYLQRALQPGWPMPAASLVVGVVWALWHAPLLFNPDAIQSELHAGWYFAFVTGIAILFGWVFTYTRGSVILVTLLHATWNASAGFLLVSLATESIDTTPYLAMCTGITWIAAAVVLIRSAHGTVDIPRPA